MSKTEIVPYGQTVFSEISLDRFPKHSFPFMQRRPMKGLVHFMQEFSNGALIPHIETLRLNPEIYRSVNPLWKSCPTLYFFSGRDVIDDVVERLKGKVISHCHYRTNFDFNGLGYHIGDISRTWDNYDMITFRDFTPFRPWTILAKLGDFSKLNNGAKK